MLTRLTERANARHACMMLSNLATTSNPTTTVFSSNALCEPNCRRTNGFSSFVLTCCRRISATSLNRQRSVADRAACIHSCRTSSLGKRLQSGWDWRPLCRRTLSRQSSHSTLRCSSHFREASCPSFVSRASASRSTDSARARIKTSRTHSA